MPTGSDNPHVLKRGSTYNPKEYLDDYYNRYLSHNKNKENNMTDKITTVDAPVTFEIKETVINKGYVDADGKFVQTDGDAQVEGTVQLPQDLN